MNTKLLLLVLCCSLLTACPGTTKPTLPKTVTIVVKEFRPLPTWATEQVKKATPSNGTVGEHLKSEDARGNTIDYVNCRSLLLQKLDKGETVDKKDCEVK